MDRQREVGAMIYSTSIFEYGVSVSISDRESLENYLVKVWNKQVDLTGDDDLNIDHRTENNSQGFLTFDGKNARAKNFIGFIQTESCHIEIYPKVFRGTDLTNANKEMFIRHIFYWFSYCRKWKFPITDVDLNFLDEIDFPELVINLMASKIRDVISNTPISLYQEIEESLLMPRGRINFARYISIGFTNGNQHILECDYEPLMFDNTLNRIIKYVTRILQNKAKFTETQQLLNDIIFILDEVEDTPCSVKELNSIKLNSFFSDYVPVLDICRLVVEQQLYSNEHYEQSQWCLLFPMEYIFEDFVAGYLEMNFPEWEVKYQKSDMFLVEDPYTAFQMRHDIFLTLKANRKINIIVDTKYKARDPFFKNESKRNVEQGDMYQMASYALRRGCEQVLLLYPNISDDLNSVDIFTIKSGFEHSSDKIHITAAEIPFWSMASFNKKNMDVALFSAFSKLLTSFLELPATGK